MNGLNYTCDNICIVIPVCVIMTSLNCSDILCSVVFRNNLLAFFAA